MLHNIMRTACKALNFVNHRYEQAMFEFIVSFIVFKDTHTFEFVLPFCRRRKRFAARVLRRAISCSRSYERSAHPWLWSAPKQPIWTTIPPWGMKCMRCWKPVIQYEFALPWQYRTDQSTFCFNIHPLEKSCISSRNGNGTGQTSLRFRWIMRTQRSRLEQPWGV